jgi:predicted amidophosphoribosyltransferase
MTKPHCPNCESLALDQNSDATYTCRECGSRFSASGVRCPGCGASNAFHTDRCTRCGGPLTSFGRALSRQGAGQRPYKLDQVRVTASRVRAEEEQASRERFGALEQIDQVRIQAEIEAAEAAAARDRRLFKVVFIGSTIFLLVVVFVVLLLTSF